MQIIRYYQYETTPKLDANNLCYYQYETTPKLDANNLCYYQYETIPKLDANNLCYYQYETTPKLDANNLCYYQYETTLTPYKSNQGQDKIAKKYERVQHSESPKNIVEKLWHEKEEYLVHRFQEQNDKYEWKFILETVGEMGPILHMDFSENITATPKFVPQSSHFSKRQFSLHCTVMHTTNDNGLPSNVYIYHLSDDIKHDSIFTMNVVQDLLMKFNLHAVNILHFKSDNCSSQYKSKFVFQAWKTLAVPLTNIIIYYGVKAHGKGLVDSMSGFGVKTPLKRAIVTEGFFFSKSDDLKIYLEEKNENNYKVYVHLDIMDREVQREGFKIKGCQKLHMIT